MVRGWVDKWTVCWGNYEGSRDEKGDREAIRHQRSQVIDGGRGMGRRGFEEGLREKRRIRRQ